MITFATNIGKKLKIKGMKALKNLLLSTLCSLLALLYITATMGIGLHECQESNSRALILFFGESPCEYVHSHIDKEGHIYTHSHAPYSAEGNIAHNHGTKAGCGCKEHLSGEEGFCLHKHNAGCCKTTAFVLSHEQESQHSLVVERPHFQLLCTIPSLSASCGKLHANAHIRKNPLETVRVPIPQSVELAKIGLFLI